MNIEFFCPRWGCEHLTYPEFCELVAAAGYDGIETFLPTGDEAESQRILESVENAGLKLILQHWETVEPDFEEHKRQYRARLQWQADAKPMFINSQTGLDWFTFEQNRELIALASEIETASGVRVVHETHRRKFSFCAATTYRFLRDLPDLRLTADFSHWCNVSESLLEDQVTFVDLAIERADHFHARIGFQQGPQIPDPRAPEWQEVVDVHLGWWDRIVARHRERGAGLLTISPEFGPYPYMQIQPFSKEPLANQWDINIHMMKLLRERYR